MPTPEVPLRVTQVLCSDRFFGIERYVVTLARGLAEHGCEVTVIGGPATRMRRELDGVPVSWYPASGVVAALGRLLRLGRADVIHAHMTHAELAAVLARPITRAPVVVTRHFAARRGSAPGGRLAAMGIRRGVELQIACSEYVSARIDGPSVVVAPGVSAPPARAEAARAEPARAPVVLVLQRLEPAKDTATALRAWAASGLGERGWTLEIVGDGSDEGSLRGLAGELGIERACRFLGASENVDAHLARASILLASAPEEPFGLSVLEAMAAGMTVVATGSAGHLETVGRCPGAALFPPADAERAGGLLRELAADEARRIDYGRALQTLASEEFTVEREVSEILACYRSVARRGEIAEARRRSAG